MMGAQRTQRKVITMKDFDFTPRGVCSRNIHFTLDGTTIRGVQFTGGCDGNLRAIGKLVEGKDAAEVAAILKGNDCNGRGTSCADQLARALEIAMANNA